MRTLLRVQGLFAIAVLTTSVACVMSWDTMATEGAPLTPQRTVRGTISGLEGSGLVLTTTRGGDITVDKGATSFDFRVGQGENYAIAVKAPPRSPVQHCVIANGAGTVREQDVTDVVIVCATLGFTLGVNVSGLAGALTLSNGAETLLVQSNGLHAFAPVPVGQAFSVAVSTQPRTQRCLVEGGVGAMGAADVTVMVRCTDSFLETFDAAEDLPHEWRVSTVGPAGAVQWHVSDEGADSAPRCARIATAPYMIDTSLTTPPIVIEGSKPQVRFRHAYEAEQGYDGGVLELQVEGGPFVDVIAAGGTFSSSGYTGRISGFTNPPLNGRNAWTGSSGGYVTSVVNLPSTLSGKKIVLRWRWGNDDNGSVPNGGWRIDNVAVHR